jgi:hypothetical protein
VCSTGNEELTAKITPCDGTKNSTKWCCGASTDCCSGDSDVKPVELAQILGAVSSSVVSVGASTTTSTAVSTTSQGSASGAPTAVTTESSGSKGLSGGAIAGIVIGALAGLVLIIAALFFARRVSQKKQAGYAAPPSAEHVLPAEVPAYSPEPPRQEMSSTVKYAHVAEMSGSPPSELPGDPPVHASRL